MSMEKWKPNSKDSYDYRLHSPVNICGSEHPRESAETLIRIYSPEPRLESSKSSFNPTAETLDEFPAVTLEKPEEWELEKESHSAPFGRGTAFKVFNLVFLPEAVNLIVNKVSGHDHGRFKERIVVGS